jgi:hypothetical protein
MVHANAIGQPGSFPGGPLAPMSWGYVYGPNSPAWSVHITARRTSDGRSTPSSAGKPNSWGNMMSTASGCVRIEAYVQRGTARGPVTMSSCYSSGGPVETG